MGKELSDAPEELMIATLERAIVMMDGDPAGREAREKIPSRLARRLWVRAVDLPDGGQPDTVPVPEGKLKELLASLF